jgi:hypothetical protein
MESLFGSETVRRRQLPPAIRPRHYGEVCTGQGPSVAAVVRPLNEASISRVQVGRGRFVLRATGGPVDLEDHPAGAPAAELMDSMLILLV